MFTTREDAMRIALEKVTRERCAIGQHVVGCPHRPTSPWVLRALGYNLPASDRTGRILTANKS